MEATAEVTRIPGSAFVTDLRKNVLGTTKAYRYWVGLTPDCPLGDISCAGLSFPKTNDDLYNVQGEMRTQRSVKIGAITFIDAARLQLLKDRLPRLVIRFGQPPVGSLNVGDQIANPQPRRAGSLHEIPTPAEVKERRDMKAPTLEYNYQQGDENAAKYMFMVLCPDQEAGKQGDKIPQTLDQTGVIWPEPTTFDELLGS